MGAVDEQTFQLLPKAEGPRISVEEEALLALEMALFRAKDSHLPWRIVSELEEGVVLPFSAQVVPVVLAALEGYHRCFGSLEVVEAGEALVRSDRLEEVEEEQEAMAPDH